MVQLGRVTCGLCILGALLLAAPPSQAQQADVALFLRLENMRGDEPPQLLADDILFSFGPTRITRSVGVAFGHEDWRTVHKMRLNRAGVFFLLYPRASVPEELASVEYRLIVDGIWMGDPNNPMVRYTTNGASLSQLRLPPRQESLVAPLLENDQVEFRFVPLAQLNVFGVDGERLYFDVTADLEVSVAGSFNNWNPFLQPLSEDANRPGSYRLRIPLPPGRHEYYFVVNGRKVLDPHNSAVGVNRVGRRASILVVAGR